MADGKVTILVDVNGNEVKVLNSQLDALEGKSSKAGASIKNIATALGIVKVAGAVFNFIKSGVSGVLSELEQGSATWKTFNGNMENIGKSKSEIAAVKKELQDFATKTIYSASDMATTYSQLEAVGIKSANKLVKGFGGLAAAAENPQQAMKTLSQQATQMAAKPMVQWQDFKLMLEQTPAGVAAVAKTMGKSTAELVRDVQNGTIKTQEFFDAITKTGTNETFTKMATEYKTVGQAMDGLTETLVTKLQPAYDSASQGIIDGIEKIINAVDGMNFDPIVNTINFIKENADVIGSLAVGIGIVVTAVKIWNTITAISNGLALARAVSSGLMTTAMAAETAAASGASGAFGVLNAVMSANPIGIVIMALAALVTALVFFFAKTERGQKIWGRFTSFLQSTWAKTAPFLIQTVGKIKEQIAQVVPIFQKFGDTMKKVASAGFEKFVSLMEKVGPVVSGVFSKGLEIASGLLEKFGGSFGKIGGAVSIFISILTKVAIAALGISGPIGLVISVLVSFLTMWAKTGELNADGITKVFDNLGNSITNVAQMISDNLPMIVGVATQIITKLVEGIAQAIPILVEVATTILNSLVEGLLVALPLIINVGLQLLTALINGIVTALPVIIEAATTILNSLVTAIVTALPLLLDVGLQIITALLNAIITALPVLIQAALTIITTLITGIITVLPMIIETGIQVLMALIQGIITILPTLIEAALQIIITLITALIAALPQIIDAGIQLLMALIQGIISILPQLIAAGIQIITALLGALIKAIPQLLDAGIKLITALVKGVISILPQLVSAALQLMAALLKALIGAVPQILSAGIKLIQALIKGVLTLLGSLISAGAKLITSLVSKILGFAGRLLSAGASLIGKLVSGITGKIGSVIGAAGRIGSSILDKLRGINLFSIGKNIIQGLINGIGSMVGAVASKISEVAGNIKKKITGALGIHSPSRWMRDHVGKYIPQGIAVGIDKDADSALKSMQRLSAGLMSVTPETALGTNRVGMSSIGSQIVNNTYNTNNGSDLKQIIDAIQQRPLVVQSILDGQMIGNSVDQTNGAVLKRKFYTNGSGV